MCPEASAVDKLNLYTRMLYSEVEANSLRDLAEKHPEKLSDAAIELISSIDFDFLRVEQGARARNLGRQLRCSCPCLTRSFSDSFYESLVFRFCNSPEFWTSAGRSLAENFCLFVYNILRADKHYFWSELAKLEGIISGLSKRPTASSPWQGSIREVPRRISLSSEGAVEVFRTPFKLISPDGVIPANANANAFEEFSPLTTYVCVVSMSDKHEIDLLTWEVPARG